ncbi:unnamed protein product [Symbiodinium natans]|uniref:GST C-terminal domain-containing protein n=1 Tax=Symbiodinium natans TaxID=878477 RepID=A0A812RYJ2_9DINO|nr:unnamed protein product [Symbiodinium natans]
MEQPHSALPIAAAVAAVYSAAALLFAHWSFSTTAVACALPLVLLASALAARAIRGDPATLKGIEVGLTERGLFHQAGDLIGGDRLNRPRFLLVAMPINHFGERVRWALDLIGAPYEEYTVGGLISAFLRGRSVPQLIDRKTCSLIGNSDECLAYLSAAYVPSITDARLRSKAISFLRNDEQTAAWDVKLNQLGHLVQGWAYFYVLDPDTTPEGCLTAWGGYEPMVPLTHRVILRLGHPFFRFFMRMAFELSSPDVRDRRRKMIDAILDEADSALSKQKYLTGDELSHVDITFSALVAPLLAGRLVLAPQSSYAKGRFSSFNGAMKRMSDRWPQALAEFELNLLKRPCAKHVISLYEVLRSKQL